VLVSSFTIMFCYPVQKKNGKYAPFELQRERFIVV